MRASSILALPSLIRFFRQPLPILDRIAQAETNPGATSLFTVGGTTYVLISDDAMLRAVMHAQSRMFHRAPGPAGILRRFLGDGLLTMEGESWFARRKLVQPAFHRSSIPRLAETMIATGRAMLDSCAPGVGEMREIWSSITQEIMVRALFSSSLSDEERARLTHDVLYGLNYLDGEFAIPFAVPQFVPLPHRRNFSAAKANLIAAMERLIAERRAMECPPEDLLTMLIRAEDADTGDMMSAEDIRNEVLTMFMAGHETTANTLTFLSWVLARYPDVAARMKAEVETVTGGAPLAYQHLADLHLVNAVINETMRLYPVIWMTSRMPIAEINLEGLRVTPNTVILVSPYLLHRARWNWGEDAQVFRPERFLEHTPRSGPTFLPFSFGPRICVGEHFARMELQILAALFVTRWNVQTTTPELSLRTGSVMRPARPVQLMLY